MGVNCTEAFSNSPYIVIVMQRALNITEAVD